MSSEPYVGSIKTFAFSFAPRGYVLCNGAILPISQNTTLFSLIGTTYGGNGQQTFAVPDLRGRVPVGQGNGPGLSPYVIGQIAGTETVTLTQLQMPLHTHTFSGTGSTLNATQIKATDQAPDTGSKLARPTTQNNTDIPQIYVPASTTGDQVALGGLNVAGQIAPAGGSQPFPIVQPYLGLNFSIATTGIYPSRN